MISIIAAMQNDRGIGVNNRLPWRQKADLQRFKLLTTGQILVMGRKTFESVGCLPQRHTWVISDSRTGHGPGYEFMTLQEAVEKSENQQVFVCGGAQIYNAFLPLAYRLHLTVIEGLKKCDTFFPPLTDSRLKVVDIASYPESPDNEFPYKFIDYEARSPHSTQSC